MKNSLKRALNVLNIADIHFGKKNDEKLYKDLKEGFLNEIPNIIKEYDHLDMVVIEGDLYDRVIKMNEVSANYVLKFISELCEMSKRFNFYIRLIKGTKSHDANQLNNFDHLEIKYPLFKMYKSVNSETIALGEYEYNILYLPEEYPEKYDKYYHEYFNHENNYDMIFGHGMMDFISFTGNDEDIKKLKRSEAVHSVEKLLSLCNYHIVFGHIHDFKNYKDQDKVFYTGSFERFSFLDQEDKGYLLTRVDPETDETEAIFYENKNASSYKILNLSEYNFKTSDEILKFIEKEKKNYDFVKIIIDNNENNKDLLKGVINDEVKVEIKNKLPDEEVIDPRLMFLINKELPMDKSIAKYISITDNETVPLEVINKMISGNN